MSSQQLVTMRMESSKLRTACRLGPKSSSPPKGRGGSDRSGLSAAEASPQHNGEASAQRPPEAPVERALTSRKDLVSSDLNAGKNKIQGTSGTPTGKLLFSSYQYFHFSCFLFVKLTLAACYPTLRSTHLYPTMTCMRVHTTCVLYCVLCDSAFFCSSSH